MNKRDLVRELAARTGLRLAQAQMVVEALFSVQDEPGIIASALRSGQRVSLPGFGVFEVRPRKPRKARNPRTGEPVDIPSRRVPRFKAGRYLKEFVAG
ncbi:MAG: HU family DNA-binding protein [Acidobacteria bacterium]|nr:HU family DNA-binding protein [Acidobacteriota bacterium]MDW7984376.1 HU family DNA-binding protein [Acidobacteriota bacterium]